MRICQLFITLAAFASTLQAAAPFSTFLRAGASIGAVATDGAGNIFVLGYVQDSPIPGRQADFFVMRLDPGATKVAYYQYFGGSNYDTGNGLAVDAAGNAFITGFTNSSDFPTTNGSAASASANHQLPFVMKLNPAGDIVFSSIFETATPATPQAIALDSAGNIVVTGVANANYPGTAGAYQNPLGGAFVTKLDPTGTRVIFSVAGAGGSHLVLGTKDEIYVSSHAGGTWTPVTPGALQTTFVPSYVCGFPCQITFPAPVQYISKLSADGSNLIYSTFLSGSNGAESDGLAVDKDGNVYVTGQTASTDFPYTDTANSNSRAGAFLSKLDPTGSHLVWSVRQGGTELAVDANGNLAVAGYWGPKNNSPISIGIVYPVAVPTGNTPSACLANQLLARQTAFLQHFSPADGSLVATQIYPAGFVQPTALSATADGRVLMAGNTELPDVALTAGVVFDDSLSDRVVSGAFLAAFDQNGSPAGGPLSCVLDALGNNMVGPVAGGEMLTLLGSGFGPGTPVAGSITGPGSVATTLGGVTVTFDGVLAPLAYAADGQINLSVPFEVTNNPSTLMVVNFNGQAIASRQFAVAFSNPTLFTDTSSLTQCTAGLTLLALNADGSHNSCDHPAKAGSVVTLLINGANVFAGSPPPTGSITGPNPPFPATPVAVSVGGISLAAGPLSPWPGVIAGVYELPVTLPSTVSPFSSTLGVKVSLNNLPAGPLVAGSLTPTGWTGLIWVTP